MIHFITENMVWTRALNIYKQKNDYISITTEANTDLWNLLWIPQ